MISHEAGKLSKILARLITTANQHSELGVDTEAKARYAMAPAQLSQHHFTPHQSHTVQRGMYISGTYEVVLWHVAHVSQKMVSLSKKLSCHQSPDSAGTGLQS